MFNGKKLDNLNERMKLMTELIIKLDKRMIELKMLVLENRNKIIENGVDVKRGKIEVKITEPTSDGHH